MKQMILLAIALYSTGVMASLPVRYTELLPYVQEAPDQGDTNTCWFMASTGAMELLLNKRDGITNPVKGGKNDLAESFIIWQKSFYNPENPSRSFIEEVVKNFNWGEAVHISEWPYNAYNSDGTPNWSVWNKHPHFGDLPRVQVPQVETVFLFSRGKRWATYVLKEEDVQKVKEALVKYQSPVIINYNDDGFWHVILIVGYDDQVSGDCYETPENECNKTGSFYIRDSFGVRYEARAYNWFLTHGNAAAVVKLK